MVKEKSAFKNGKRNNKPYYLQDISKKDDMIIIDEQITEKIKEDEKINKFKISVLKDKTVLLSIDGERPHIIYPKQFFAMTLASINISKIIIPNCNFYKVMNQE